MKGAVHETRDQKRVERDRLSLSRNPIPAHWHTHLLGHAGRISIGRALRPQRNFPDSFWGSSTSWERRVGKLRRPIPCPYGRMSCCVRFPRKEDLRTR